MKLAKSQVEYEAPAQGKDHCSLCRHFKSPRACELVAGKIEPIDWCKLFERRRIRKL